MSGMFIGIDVSKLKLDAAATVDGLAMVSRKTVDNNAKGWRALSEWARRHARKLKLSGIHYVFESTGIYGHALLEFLEEEPDAIVSMVNPMQIKGFGTSLLKRTKTDKADAELIARFAAIMKPLANERIPSELKELKALVRHHRYLMDRRAEVRQRMEGVTNPDILSSMEDSIENDSRQIKEIERKIRAHIGRHPGLKRDVELLKSIPGISDTTAHLLLCEMHAARKEGKLSRKAQTAHAGLAPMQRQSGSSVRGKTKLCKAGNARIRKGLYFPAVTAIKCNVAVSEFYGRLVSNGKSKMVALTAAMRKLLGIAIGVLNNQTPFDQQWHKQKPA